MKHGKIYDANGVEFLARGINRAHVPDYGVGWPAMERARFNAVRQGAFFFYRRGCAGIERPSSWPTDLMQEAILHEQVVVPATFYLRCWYAGAPVTLGPKEGPNADGTWPEMEAALDLIIARAAALKRMERHVWIDPVNEWGNSITRDRSWIDGYSHAIMRLRGTHPRCVSTPSYCMSPPWGGPIVVGLNGGGQSLSNLFANDPRTGTNLMQQLWNADPHKNLIVSIHVYGLWCDSAANAPCNPIEWQWKSYDIGRHFDEIRAHADRIGYGVVIGEFGPGGGMQLDDVTDVTAIRVMQRAQEVGFGWFAWAWDDDHACGGSPPFCGEGYPPRPCFLIPKYCGNGGTALYRTTADLTPFGVTIIEHPRYGSRATSMKATTFP